MKSKLREDILVAVMILVPILAVAIPAFLIHAAPEKNRAGTVYSNTVSFDTSELTADGVSYRKTLEFISDGAIREVRVYKSGASCTSIEFWIQEKDETVANSQSNLNVVLDIDGDNQSDAYVVYQADYPVYFQAETSGELVVTAKATGGACNVDMKIIADR